MQRTMTMGIVETIIFVLFVMPRGNELRDKEYNST